MEEAKDPQLAELLDRVASFIRRFIVLRLAEAQVLALWIVHTHAVDAVDITPYIYVHSAEKRCGKSRTKEVVGLLVPRPWKTEHATPAAIYRKVHSEKPTLFLDEIDSALGGSDEYVQALRGLLNSGFERGGVHSLCVGKASNQTVVDFQTFCPKMILGIGNGLPDTVRDRSIVIPLKRRISSESIERFRRRKVKPEAAELQVNLVLWAAANTALLIDAEPELPEALNDRVQDVVEPLVAIADLAGGEWSARARRALVELLTSEESEDDSMGVTLLRDCRVVFEEQAAARLASDALVQALNVIETSPWAGWHKGKGLTPNTLAKLLRRYRVAPRQFKDGTKKLRGYLAEDFGDSWSRYLLPAPSVQETFETVPPVPAAPALAQTDVVEAVPEALVPPSKSEEGPIKTRVVPPVPFRGTCSGMGNGSGGPAGLCENHMVVPLWLRGGCGMVCLRCFPPSLFEPEGLP